MVSNVVQFILSILRLVCSSNPLDTSNRLFTRSTAVRLLIPIPVVPSDIPDIAIRSHPRLCLDGRVKPPSCVYGDE